MSKIGSLRYCNCVYLVKKKVFNINAFLIFLILSCICAIFFVLSPAHGQSSEKYISFDISKSKKVTPEPIFACKKVTEPESIVAKKAPEPSKKSVVAKKETTPKLVYWKTVKAKITAYTPGKESCGRYADGRTSIGRNAWRMTGVATAPKAIPYGTVIDIPGIGKKIVDDTGSAMRRSARRGVYHIDLRMIYPYQCKKWGIRWMNVKLYRIKKA